MPIQNCGEKNTCSSNILTEEQFSNLDPSLMIRLNPSQTQSKCRCVIDYNSLYKEAIISPFEETEFINYASVIHLSSNKHYELSDSVNTVILPLVADDQDKIIIQDFNGVWNLVPLKIFNFSSYCYGVKLNKPNTTISLIYNKEDSQWELEGWSYECVISPEIKRYRNYLVRYKYDQNNVYENIYNKYYLRIVGFGYSTFIDINTIWAGDDVNQIYFYPINGSFIIDLKDEFNKVNTPDEIQYNIGSIDGFEYYRLYYAGQELLSNSLQRQRLKFYNERLFDIEDGDMLLRSIYILQIGTDTKTRDPIILNNIDISNVDIYNINTFYKYEENKDYIIKSSTGEIIPTIIGKIMPGDYLRIRYAT